MSCSAPLAPPAAVPRDLAGTYRPADRCAWLMSGGARLRYGWWNGPTTPRGTVLLVSGRTEFLEKYATEVVGELIDKGFAVVAMDWRGQGLSDRPLPDHDKGHIDSFATYLADLRLFLDTVVVPQAKGPILALCHSMGGHLLLRWLAQNGSAPLAGAVLTSPMMALHNQGLLRNVLRLTPSIAAFNQRYLYGTGPFSLKSHKFTANMLTHDERRFRFTEQWFASDPRLTLGGPTIEWCRQALWSMTATLAPGVLEKIDLPLLIVSSGQDRLVDVSSHGLVAARIRNSRHITINGARHEPMMEADDLRTEFWQAFDRFAKDTVG